MTPKVLWEVVKDAASQCGIDKLAPHDLRRYAECLIMPNVLMSVASVKFSDGY